MRASQPPTSIVSVLVVSNRWTDFTKLTKSQLWVFERSILQKHSVSHENMGGPMKNKRVPVKNQPFEHVVVAEVFPYQTPSQVQMSGMDPDTAQLGDPIMTPLRAQRRELRDLTSRRSPQRHDRQTSLVGGGTTYLMFP